MIDPDPQMRPAAVDLVKHLSLIEGFQTNSETPLYGHCCTPQRPGRRVKRDMERLVAEIEDLKIQLAEKNDNIGYLSNSMPVVPPPSIGEDFTRLPPTNQLGPATSFTSAIPHAFGPAPGK